ncbi:MAG: DNA-binding protein WhiA [Anaerostipes sp.]|uniref:DNA-binding protein WhiA n=1 Tax=Anaerostipes sp. 992a TaxID=1261637 RepID=UPI0009534876|nr:DNA-binding protein WhiA [Anaerostipes sp. 992a]MCI5951029.1 DNA-binding protein WhiA [Anaerostipes sp.]MDD5968545.1 DNA-binding protein WhiA [Anaerostipes sp.]OLR62889.1 DNA-binding protein WhiA [Anaerostipes sp. 992a]
MSFSSEVKEELARHIGNARHCKIAELAAFICFCGKVVIDEENHYALYLHTENTVVAKKCFTLLKETFGIHPTLTIGKNVSLKKNRIYEIIIDNHTECVVILQAMKILDSFENLEENVNIVNHIILQNTCCKRAFIRGAFLSSGSISAPDKNYHFEVVCLEFEKAKQLMGILNSFDLDAKIVRRKKYYVVYIKEGAKIVDVLNIMEAHVSLMKLENVRILKDVRNRVNRQVNCEAANIQKTVSAAMRQIEDIQFLMDHKAFNDLPSNLQDIANLRLEYPEASLKKLGDMLNPPVGKSGVNHRLRKISNIAQDLRESM